VGIKNQQGSILSEELQVAFDFWHLTQALILTLRGTLAAYTQFRCSTDIQIQSNFLFISS